MNLLDSLLRTTKAENYLPNFTSAGVDIFTLKILSDQDLQILGIDNEEIRKSILKHVENLQIPAETKIPIIVDNQYIKTVLNQISFQLKQHLANLTIASSRSDVIICDIKLFQGTKYLLECATSLETELGHFYNMTNKRKNKKYRSKIPVVSAVVITCVTFLAFKRWLM